jgi:hypothetical protein
LKTRRTFVCSTECGNHICARRAVTTTQRKTILARAIEHQVALGGRVESSGDFHAVVIFGKPVNHILHFLIGIVTLTIWWLVWLLLVLGNNQMRRTIFVTEDGLVQSTDMKF